MASFSEYAAAKLTGKIHDVTLELHSSRGIRICGINGVTGQVTNERDGWRVKVEGEFAYRDVPVVVVCTIRAYIFGESRYVELPLVKEIASGDRLHVTASFNLYPPEKQKDEARTP